jgi:hypothetical protein
MSTRRGHGAPRRLIPEGRRANKRSIQMRRIAWACVVLTLLLVESEIACAVCISCNGADACSYRAYRGPACCCPPGYALAPGCCECPPSACDNAWDGYCEEKAKWQAFFARVGTPKVYHHGCPTMVPVESCSNYSTAQPAAEPQPKAAAQPDVQPIPAAPKPLPDKATSKPAYKWFR